RYNNNKEYREYLRLIRSMNPEQKAAFELLLEDVKKVRDEAERKNITKKQFAKALFIVDMNNGFVNFGAMHNKAYNDLVPEQQKLIDKFRREEQLVNFIMEGHVEDAVEFLLYPGHCIADTPEAELIPQLKKEEEKENTNIYYKNSINGGLNMDLAIDLEELTDLKEIVIAGVCTDLCVLDFAKTLARLVEEINLHVHIFVVASAVSTFDAPGHNKEEETAYAFEVMRKSGIEVVDDFDHLERREKELKLIA
ncbi:MAG: cysteine hydrolase, partial [Bacilli bacterium]|nr:cysteine hydrolase [Bacilli bacterium]